MTTTTTTASRLPDTAPFDLAHASARARLALIDSRAVSERYRLRSGTFVHWRRFGSGAPLVLIHGGHGNWTHWLRNVEVLATGRAVWVPDLPSYGDSGALAPEAGFDALVDATLESLDGLVGHATPVDMVGFSFGALVASTLAGRRPGGKLALVASAGHGGPRRCHPALRNWKKATSEAVRRELFAFNLKAFMFHDPDAVDALAVAAYEEACLKTRFRSKEISRTGGLAGRLRASGARPLLVWGTHDVTAADSARFSTVLREAGVPHVFRQIADAGHWVQFEKADEVNALLLEWLTGPTMPQP